MRWADAIPERFDDVHLARSIERERIEQIDRVGLAALRAQRPAACQLVIYFDGVARSRQALLEAHVDALADALRKCDDPALRDRIVCRQTQFVQPKTFR